MSYAHRRTPLVTALVLVAALGAGNAAAADQEARQTSKPQSPPPTPGVDLIGSVATSWPTAKDSFEAAGLEPRPLEFGGGVQFTNAWRDLFVQFNVNRWSDEGERVFLAANGERFPLGIPLNVTATFLDISAGWEFKLGRRTQPRVLPYIGAGAGSVFYKEESPFAEPDDEVDERVASYHVAAGVQIRLLNWLGVGFDTRYRYVPDLFGKDGISGALGDDSFGGLQASVGVRVGRRGTRPRPTPPRDPALTPPTERVPPGVVAPTRRLSEASMIESGPVFLYPDATREPMRVLQRGTRVRILEERGDWVLIEFEDTQYGPRRGFVQRKLVLIPK